MQSQPAADPDRVIAAFLAAASSAEPEPVFLAWLMSLDAALDPAEAAEALLADLPGTAPPPAPPTARLMAMLADTTRWPRPALAALPSVRRRLGTAA